MIELRSGQGNSALESALTLTASLQKEIILLGHKIASLAPLQTSQVAIRHLVTDIRTLLNRINESIPLLQLAISASGESLSTNLPDSVSPSRMLQASAFLMIADSHFTAKPETKVQVGPDFMVSVYMIFKGYSYEPSKKFANHANSQKLDIDNIRKPIWQEVLHKARLRVHRTPHPRAQMQQNGLLCPSEYSYHLEIEEDRDDGRLHNDPESPAESSEPDLIPITEITKLLYTNSASILNIKDDLEACSTPILLLKREVGTDFRNVQDFNTPDDEMQHSNNGQILSECNGKTPHDETSDSNATPPHCSQFPSYLDPEWIALEMYSADASDESQCDQSDAESTQASSSESEQDTNHEAVKDGVVSRLGSLSLGQERPQRSEDRSPLQHTATSISRGVPNNVFSLVTTSLSLLELVIRLTVLQETQQKSHLSVPDHVLTSFLIGTVQPRNTGTCN